ncbi:unnamed protein product [Rhodiola kirilowii]
MKLKQLEGLLGDLQQFDNPKVELEQYPTGPHIASRMLYTADFSFGDVTDKVVADFGCGCGTLGIAADLLDAGHVIGIDVDAESLETASGNAADLEVNVDFIQCDIGTFRWRGQIIDTVVMNPPFGTRKKGADMDFLQKALKIASGAVYSLHKTTTREHIKRTALRDYNATSAEVICELRYDVPQMYKFHKKKEVDIAVDLWRFVPQNLYKLITGLMLLDEMLTALVQSLHGEPYPIGLPWKLSDEKGSRLGHKLGYRVQASPLPRNRYPLYQACRPYTPIHQDQAHSWNAGLSPSPWKCNAIPAGCWQWDLNTRPPFNSGFRMPLSPIDLHFYDADQASPLSRKALWVPFVSSMQAIHFNPSGPSPFMERWPQYKPMEMERYSCRMLVVGLEHKTLTPFNSGFSMPLSPIDMERWLQPKPMEMERYSCRMLAVGLEHKTPPPL